MSLYYPCPSSFACHRCFEEKKLVPWIKDQGTKGKCDCCGARNAYLIDIVQLGELFEPIVELYHPSDSFHGDSLSELLQWNWEIFSDRIMDKGLARDLVTAIMTTGVDPKS